MPQISRDMITIIQGLVILFAGALEHMFRPAITAFFVGIRGIGTKPAESAAE
jgi:simple sugar transport system permease protein